jgi:hypothetical protein
LKPANVATIAGDAEIDQAAATLVLAFGTDPVARWMYMTTRLNICCAEKWPMRAAY